MLAAITCLFFLACDREEEPKNVTLIAHLNQYAATGYNDCWGYTAPDGREYALLGVKNGTSIIDVTTDDAVEIAFIASDRSDWKDIKTYDSYAYAVNESGGGIQIIDLSDLPNSATLAATYTGLATSHNIFIDVENGILYAEGGGSGPVRVLSLENPENPVEIATFGVECHDIYVQDNKAYISEGNQGSIGIFDVSDPAAPNFVQRIHIPLPGYAHNAWVTEEGSYLMSTEETQGKTVKLWDIRDLDHVAISDEYLGPNNLAHNAHIKGNFAYISHYASGLRIVDISDPGNIFEAGSYDTADAWGAFPFLPSGKILISDIDKGLYVVKFAPDSHALQ
jgi:choice-of-anchor B domain-containing protein